MKLLESLELIGPGRWLDRPHIDQSLQLHDAELRVLQSHAQTILDVLTIGLQSAGIEPDTKLFTKPLTKPLADPAGLVGQWLGQIAIFLQRWAGHRVEWYSTLPNQPDGVVRVLFEFEDLATGRQAGELALVLLNQALLQPQKTIDGQTIDHQTVEYGSTAARLTAFRVAAQPRIFPLDAEVLMAAAAARDIPACKLDREPYVPILGDFRRRNNGLLRFGHACHQQVVDGTLCLQRSARVLQKFSRPSAALDLLHAAGAPVARTDTDAGRLTGEHYRFLCAGQQLLAVVDDNGTDVTERCDSSWLECVAGIAQELEVGMLVLEAVCADLTRDMQHGGGVFIGLDISPQLDSLLPRAGDLCGLMADDFIGWMFPPGVPSRIPLVSVTGTNGKTTICRMLSRIAGQAGFRVGLACTDGVYINGELKQAGDYSGSDGHHLVLESHAINLGVLETARGAVLNSGFVFDHCDVAVCTNVTHEHLGEYGIETVEQMSAIKGLIVARARVAAVLNFDDAHCRRIGGDLAVPRLCWTSTRSSADAISACGARADRLVYLETVGGAEWIVCRNRGKTDRLMPVHALPSSFDGTARHNLRNAMQAMAAALELGIEWDDVHQAMSTFEMGIDSTPGRLNLTDAAGFTVLLDFVQNLDGMRALCEFVASRKVSGKRILVMSVLGRHDDATVREFARYAARHFDQFICRNYAKTYPHRAEEEIPRLLHAALLEEGVAKENTRVVIDEAPAIDTALKQAARGDLLVVMCGAHPREAWQQILDFKAGE